MKAMDCTCNDNPNSADKCPVHRPNPDDENRQFVRRLFHTVPGNIGASQEEDIRLEMLLAWKSDN